MTGAVRRGGGMLGTLLLLVAAAVAVQAQAWVIARVSFYIGEFGDVEARKSGTDEWAQVVLKQPLFSGDAVRTAAESRLEIKVDDDSVVRIGENSELEISKPSLMNLAGGGETQAKLKKGKIWSNVKKMAEDQRRMTVSTPTVVAAIRGTVFRIDVPEDSLTVLRVYEGSVEARENRAAPAAGGLREIRPPGEVAPPAEVSAQEWVQIVAANQQLTFRRGGTPQLVAFDPEVDALIEWVRWNRERDTQGIPPGLRPMPERKDK
jgi:hypothetical protein